MMDNAFRKFLRNLTSLILLNARKINKSSRNPGMVKTSHCSNPEACRRLFLTFTVTVNKLILEFTSSGQFWGFQYRRGEMSAFRGIINCEVDVVTSLRRCCRQLGPAARGSGTHSTLSKSMQTYDTKPSLRTRSA